MSVKENLMQFFRENQRIIFGQSDTPDNGNTFRPIGSKKAAKGDLFFDVLLSYNNGLYVMQHIKPALFDDIFPLDFTDSYILRYNSDKAFFAKDPLILTEDKIKQDFDYELNSSNNINQAAIAIMTTFPFMDEFSNKITASFQGIRRNESCPCQSGAKFKKCCGI